MDALAGIDGECERRHRVEHGAESLAVKRTRSSVQYTIRAAEGERPERRGPSVAPIPHFSPNSFGVGSCAHFTVRPSPPTTQTVPTSLATPLTPRSGLPVLVPPLSLTPAAPSRRAP